MSPDSQALAVLERLDARSIETVERLARIEVEVQHIHREERHAASERAALLERVDRLEAERDERAGQVETAKRTGIGGVIAGGIGVLSSIGQFVWDWIASAGSP
jgi:hypothetical protein